MPLNLEKISSLDGLKLRKTKNIEVHVYNSIPFIYTFTKLQWHQRPDSFSAFISSVSSTNLGHYANRGHITCSYMYIKS